MKNTQAGIATPILIVVVALTLFAAGSYGYSKVYRKEKAANDLITSARRSLERSSRPAGEVAAELALAKGNLQNEIDRLEIFRQSGFNSASSYGLALLSIERELSDAVIGRTDETYKLISATNIDSSLKIELTQDRQNLIALIDAWKKALDTATTQGAVGAAADAAITAAQQYAATLAQAVESLTPANSNLTETQIEVQQQVVNQATNTANQAENNINTVQPDTEVIQDLQEEVQDLEEELEEAVENNTNNTDNTNNNNNNNNVNNPPPPPPDDADEIVLPPYIPPPPPDTSGRPQLIQGANQF